MRRHAKASTAGLNRRRVGRHGGVDTPKPAGAGLLLTSLVALLSLALGAASASAAVPSISSTTPSAVTTKSAVLKAVINPEGEATTFHFEYGIADCSLNPCTSVPVPNGNVGSGSTAVPVSREIAGLTPGTAYHFRVVALNGSGPAEGPDRAFTTYPASPPDASCPNHLFRIGAAATLPDCRAYEMVSPLDKNGGDILALAGGGEASRTSRNQASIDGNAFTYSSYKSFGDAPTGPYSSQYLATRTADGWLTHGISAPQGTTIFDPNFAVFIELNSYFEAFTDDLSSAWLRDFNKTPLTPDGLSDYTNLYRRDNFTESYTALTNEGPFGPAENTLGEGFRPVELQGFSADGSVAIFSANAALTPDAAATNKTQLYEFADGELSLVSLHPGEIPSTEGANVGTLHIALGGPRRVTNRHRAVSADGSIIYWSDTPPPNNEDKSITYVRINGQETIQVSPELAQFWTATVDGSRALYSTGSKANSDADLFEFDLATKTSTLVAGEVRGVLGASDDFSYIYFVSKENLAAGSVAGERNLYVKHGSDTDFIGVLSAQDVGDSTVPRPTRTSVVTSEPHARSSRIAPDGRHIAFTSHASLTGYDNTDETSGEPAMEVFVYSAEEQQLTCVSCNPSGARPVAQPMLYPFTASDEPVNENGNPQRQWAAAWLTTWETSLHAPRALADDGSRVFFNAYDALLPQDTNGVLDVYQWEAPGSGTCQKAGGCVSLISTGQSPLKSEFVDASPDGSDVFFETSSSIDPRDPGLIDIYNARVDGGFPISTEVDPCVGDSCQSPPAPPNDPTPASASFRGAGSPPAGKPRKRCRVRRQSARKGKGAKQTQHKRCKRAKGRAAK